MIHVQTHGLMGVIHEIFHWDGLRFHDLCSMFHKDLVRHSKVKNGETQTQRQHGDRISLVCFFYQNKKSTLTKRHVNNLSNDISLSKRELSKLFISPHFDRDCDLFTNTCFTSPLMPWFTDTTMCTLYVVSSKLILADSHQRLRCLWIVEFSLRIAFHSSPKTIWTYTQKEKASPIVKLGDIRNTDMSKSILWLATKLTIDPGSQSCTKYEILFAKAAQKIWITLFRVHINKYGGNDYNKLN
jgi:hypothetical protein